MNTGFQHITDGTSNTLLIVESKMAVPWTKPEEIDFDPQNPLPQIGGWYPDGFCAAMCDGRSLFIPDAYDRMQLRHLITRNDGVATQPPDARR